MHLLQNNFLVLHLAKNTKIQINTKKIQKKYVITYRFALYFLIDVEVKGECKGVLALN
jgi:hypothetical protein